MKFWCILMLIASILAIVGLSVAINDIFAGLGVNFNPEIFKEMKLKDIGLLVYAVLQIYGIPLILFTVSLIGIRRQKN